MARSSTVAGLSRVEIASLICPSPSPLRLACRQRQRQSRPSPLHWTDAAGPRQKRVDRRRVSIKPPPDRAHRLSTLPAIPDLRLLLLREIDPSAIAHLQHPISAKRLKCCDHPLSPPPKADSTTISLSRRTGTESDAVTRQAFLPFSSIRFARSGSPPLGSVSRSLRTISVKRVVPSTRSTVPLPDRSSDAYSNLEARATPRSVNKKHVSTAAR